MKFQIPAIKKYVPFFSFTDGPLCVRISIDVTEYFINAESSENFIRSAIAQCRQHGRHSRLSGKCNYYHAFHGENKKLPVALKELKSQCSKWEPFSSAEQTCQLNNGVKKTLRHMIMRYLTHKTKKIHISIIIYPHAAESQYIFAFRQEVEKCRRKTSTK